MMKRRRGLIWRAGAVMAVLLSVAGFMAAALAAKGRPAGWARSGRCSPEYPAGRGPEYVFIGRHRGQGSPRQVLEKFHKALAAGNIVPCLQCFRGTSAALCYEASRVDCEVSVAELYQAVVKRFGLSGWERLRGLTRDRPFLQPRLRLLSGRTIPKLKFKYAGNLASCIWDVEHGVGTRIWFSRCGGHWYIDATRTPYQYRNRDNCYFAASNAKTGHCAAYVAGAINWGRMGIKSAAAFLNRELRWPSSEVTRGRTLAEKRNER